MAGEALDRRKRWEPSVFYSVGKESFFFAGHDITIHESLDSYGALIWPGVSTAVILCHRRLHKCPLICTYCKKLRKKTKKNKYILIWKTL